MKTEAALKVVYWTLGIDGREYHLAPTNDSVERADTVRSGAIEAAPEWQTWLAGCVRVHYICNSVVSECQAIPTSGWF